MSITDELREWASCQVGADTPWSEVERLATIADRIDAEHESMVGCTADEWDYCESTHVELPKDADGEYIHAGDEMEWLNGLKRGRVTAIGVGEREGWVWVLMDGKNVSIGNLASDLHHHKQPTVEDVLREFADEVQRCCDTADTIAEYAAKLMLKED